MSKQEIKLSDHFNYSRLIRFVLPSIGTMLFTSIYGIVDGLFVSNFVGKTAFAAVNFILPYPMLLGGVGFMLGTGGSALVAISLGEGDQKRANRSFSLIVLTAAVAGAVMGIMGVISLRTVATWMGADQAMMDICIRYGRILMLGLPSFLLQNVLQSFFVTAEKPRLGFLFTVAAGVTNIVLDALLVGALRGGVEAAAVATVASQIVGGVLPLLYFARENTSLLRLGATRWDGHLLFYACTNGSSELMTSISMSLVNIMYNAQLMRFAGENGVAAYGVIMYAHFLFVAVFIGYAVGSAPIVSFHYGAGNHDEMRSLYHKSLRLILVVSAGMTAIAMMLIPYVAKFFVGYDAELLELTTQAFRIYAVSCLLSGFNIYGSSFFTALGNGVISALISFLRTLLFQMIAILVLPELLGLDGIWMAVTVAELMTLAVTVSMFFVQNKKYQYR